MTCNVCGKQFIPQNKRHLICSIECRKKAKFEYDFKRRDKKKIYDNDYYLSNKKFIDKYKNERSKSKEGKEINKLWRKKNSNHLKEYQKTWKKENVNYFDEYFKKNENHLKTKAKEWRYKNKDLVNMLAHTRRVKERIAEGFSTKIESFRIRMEEIGECVYCGSRENLTIEHLLPISKGGTNELHNLFPACKKCNFSKGAKDWIEWYRDQKFYSLDRECKIIKFKKG
jgi:5-methylcytosine-specific restriction endonuclease McrA